MRCSSCGSENREGRKFCAGCGAALTLACAACGANNQPAERFCGDCGKKDGALAALAQAYEQRSWYVTWWKLDPDLDPLRSDPRFAALLKKAGLEP
jgi:predicted amidophosphoribosyltransferase